MECFCFVVLHYQTQKDTIECVNSILSNVTFPNLKIVLVDNGSPNKSGLSLARLYKENPKVEVILNERNLGFTGGNNIGFKHAKYSLKADYIALINNDTIIDQNNFIETIINKNISSHFHILGPDIITPAGNHQNPVFNKLATLPAVENYIRHYRKVLFLNYLALDVILEKLKKLIIPKSNIHLENINIKTDSAVEQSGVMLHGSAIVFSKSYIDNYDGLYPGPFMYGEEAILHYIAKRDKLITLYCPDIRIIHKDDSSTNFVYRKALSKRRFYLKNFIRSLLVLQKLMKEYHDLNYS
jgi:GT2 family glycosyltransferase